jgi:hypothetical protein
MEFTRACTHTCVHDHARNHYEPLFSYRTAYTHIHVYTHMHVRIYACMTMLETSIRRTNVEHRYIHTIMHTWHTRERIQNYYQLLQFFVHTNTQA